MHHVGRAICCRGVFQQHSNLLAASNDAKFLSAANPGLCWLEGAVNLIPELNGFVETGINFHSHHSWNHFQLKKPEDLD